MPEPRTPGVSQQAAGIESFSSRSTSPQDAVAIFDRERAKCPVAHSDEYGGFYVTLGYDAVKEATSDHALFSSEPQVARPLDNRPSFAALEMDPPRHREWRTLFEQAVTPHVVSVLEPSIRRSITTHIDQFIERGNADLVEEFAEPIPAEAICRLVGIDDDMVASVRDSAIEMFAAQGDPLLFPKRAAAFAALAVGEVRRRRQDPREDYLTYMSAVTVEGNVLDDDGIFAILVGFLGAGHHSTTSALSSLIFEVFSRKDVHEKIAADPDKMIPIAVEETLRLRPPFFGFFRRAVEETTVGGVTMPAGSDVYLGWASANRDPSVFDRPHQFALDRGRNRHLTFGSGIHTCPGAPLARLELRIALEELLLRIPDLEITIEEPDYEFAGGDYVGMKNLPVRFTPGSRTKG